MRLKPPSGIKVIKKEDKEASLRAFILNDIDARYRGEIFDSPNYLLLARCWNSPVISAIIGLQDQIAAAGISVRTIVSAINTFESHALFSSAGAYFAAGGLRIATDTRLFDAHEQLVLNSKACWIGDVIRREPAKRDAYEQFSNNDAMAVHWARLAFERIWVSSVDARPCGRSAHALTPAELERQLALSPSFQQADSDSQAGTRH